MATELIETDTHVFEFTYTPGDEVPGRVVRTLDVKLLSGPELTEEQWGQVKELVVRTLIAQGNRVFRVGAIREGE